MQPRAGGCSFSAGSRCRRSRRGPPAAGRRASRRYAKRSTSDAGGSRCTMLSWENSALDSSGVGGGPRSRRSASGGPARPVEHRARPWRTCGGGCTRAGGCRADRRRARPRTARRGRSRTGGSRSTAAGACRRAGGRAAMTGVGQGPQVDAAEVGEPDPAGAARPGTGSSTQPVGPAERRRWAASGSPNSGLRRRQHARRVGEAGVERARRPPSGSRARARTSGRGSRRPACRPRSSSSALPRVTSARNVVGRRAR